MQLAEVVPDQKQQTTTTTKLKLHLKQETENKGLNARPGLGANRMV